MDNDKVNKWNVAIGLDQTPEGKYAGIDKKWGGGNANFYSPKGCCVLYGLAYY